MTSNVQNRTEIRQALAQILTDACVGTGKPAEKVYRYKVADFQGLSPVIVVTSSHSNRKKQAQVTRVSSLVYLEIHIFVVYVQKPVIATNNPNAGSNVLIKISDTSGIDIGSAVVVQDDLSYESATVSNISADTSITVSTLVNSYTTPEVYIWNEEKSEDRLDLLEKTISDTLMDNEITELWSSISFDGNTLAADVALGGTEYRHEVIPVVVQLHSD